MYYPLFILGLPMLNGDRHAAEIAYFAVHILKMLQRNTFSESMHGNKVQLQIGISTGNFIPLYQWSQTS